VVDEDEVVVADVVDVLERRGLQVVDADDPVPVREQQLTQVGAEKPGSPGDDRSGHSGEDTHGPGAQN
jgi:hypothetical protein